MKTKSIITTAVLALGLISSASAASFTFSVNGGDGSIGNTVNANSNPVGTSVAVTAYSYYNGVVSTRAVGQYGTNGLGVNNGSSNNPSDTGTPNHTVDNQNGVDMLLFAFSTNVNLSQLSLGYVSGDSDFRYWTGGLGSTASSLFGNGTGGTAVNGGSNPADYSISGTNVRYLLVAADPAGYAAASGWGWNYNPGNPYDYFKIDGITFTNGGNVPGTPDAGSTLAIFGLALAGLAAARRRFQS